MNRLTQNQVQTYEEDGCLLLEDAIAPAIVDALCPAMQRFVDRSRTMTESSPDILLGPDHAPETPTLQRIPQTVAFDPVFEDFGLRGPLLDIVEDLIGPDIRFHHSKLNFKSAGGGEEIKWDQDIQFWPHSNYFPLTVGVYLTDVDEAMAPMGVVRSSHRGPLYTLRNSAGDWTGALSDAEAAKIQPGDVKWLTRAKDLSRFTIAAPCMAPERTCRPGSARCSCTLTHPAMRSR